MRRWWQKRTLRFQLATWYALGGALLLSAFSATLYFYVAERLAQPLDQQLRRDLEHVRANLSVSPDQILLWNEQPLDSIDRQTSDIPWFEVWDTSGRLLGRWWQLDEARLERVPSAPAPSRETFSIFNVGPDLRIRSLSVPLPLRDGQTGMLRVMRNHVASAGALQALVLIIVIALPIVIALLVLGGYIMTRRWLRPLDNMVDEARRITAEDLSRRLPVANPNDELGQLATVFNVTLDRLQNSFVALDRFVADASHELRTPLTTLRSVGEVALRRSRTVEEYRDIIGSMLEESERLQALIDRLLELASAGTRTLDLQLVALDELAAACVNELAVLAEARGQTLTLAPAGCQLRTDPILLRQALHNLIDNAIKYAPPHSPIRVALTAAPDHCTIDVIDQGPGIPPEHRTRITERFYRIDRGRSRSEGGFGLGLSLANAYMRALGGSLEWAPAEPRGSIFRLRLPR